MHPILIRLGPLSIYSYGVTVALGFSIATYLIYRRAQRFGIDRDNVIDLAIFILTGGLLGARIFHVLLKLDYYLFNPREIFNLSSGGLVWYGGFFGGLALAVIYLVRKNIRIWDAADLFAPYIALAQSIGRIGCFFNGCCFGIEAPKLFLFSVVFPDDNVLRHPTQFYSSVAMLAIFIILRIWQDKRRFEGEIFLGYCILYSLKRFFMEFLRGDNVSVFFRLTLFQLLSILLFVVSSSAFIYKKIKWRKSLSGSRQETVTKVKG